MSNNESPRRVRTKTYHECVEELRILVEAWKRTVTWAMRNCSCGKWTRCRCSSSSQTIPRLVETHQPDSTRSWGGGK